MNRGTQIGDTNDVARFRALAWSDFQMFLAVAETTSFKAAAKRLGCAHNTVRNHVARLEDLMAAPLVTRTNKGSLLTELGVSLYQVALEMDAASKSGMTHALANDAASKHSVELYAGEGLGAFWLIPRLAEFKRMNADISISMHCQMHPPSINSPTTELSVQLTKPDTLHLLYEKVGTLHLMPFAAQSYLDRYGHPTCLEEARSHKWVIQQGEQVRADILTAFVGDEIPASLIALTVNTSSAHYHAVGKGIGMGMLPTYARAITRSVVPVDIGLTLRRDIWLVHHPDGRASKTLGKTIEWIRSAFDEQVYPWFSSRFIHPSVLEEQHSNAKIVRLFSDDV